MTAQLPLADELAAVFARMSGLLLSGETVSTALRLVTSLAAQTIPGTIGAGTTLVDGDGRATSRAATDELVERADALQYDLGEGPCLTAWGNRMVVRVDDLATDDRFPRWSAAAAALGLRSILSVPLVAGERVLGALKLYADGPHAYDDRTVHLATMFAAQAAVLLHNVQAYERAEQLSDQLKDAVHSRDLICQAKGVLMGREGIDDAQAFARLVAAARDRNRKLKDVARDVVRSTSRRS